MSCRATARIRSTCLYALSSHEKFDAHLRDAVQDSRSTFRRTRIVRQAETHESKSPTGSVTAPGPASSTKLPTLLNKTGVPTACASMAGKPKPSYNVG